MTRSPAPREVGQVGQAADGRVTGHDHAGDGEPSDLEAFYTAAYPRLVGVVALVAGSRPEAEECVQEAFVRLMPRWERVSRYEQPEAWVRTVAIRLLSNRRRKRTNELRAMLRHHHRSATSPPPDPTSQPSTEIAAALQQIPLVQRQVLVLHYLVGLDVAEVADALRIPQGTVKSRLSRARAALGPFLQEEESPHD